MAGEEKTKGEEPLKILRLLFLGKEDGGAAASFLFLSLGPDCIDLEQLYKQININMIIINSLRLFVASLTRGAQR